MYFAEECRAPVGKTVDEIGLPEWVSLIHRRLEEGIDELVELFVPAGRRQGDVPKVATDVEVRVVLPARPIQIEKRAERPLAVAPDGAQALGHRRPEGGKRKEPVEKCDTADVEPLVRLLVVEKRRIERGQTSCAGHRPLLWT